MIYAQGSSEYHPLWLFSFPRIPQPRRKCRSTFIHANSLVPHVSKKITKAGLDERSDRDNGVSCLAKHFASPLPLPDLGTEGNAEGALEALLTVLTRVDTELLFFDGRPPQQRRVQGGVKANPVYSLSTLCGVHKTETDLRESLFDLLILIQIYCSHPAEMLQS